MPRVSVLMPAWNSMPFLPDAVQSILNQTYADFEFIIVDDCSTDETQSYLETLTDPRIVILRNERNLGCTKSLNVGLRECHGEIICRMDADDISLPQRLELQIAEFDRRPDLICCGTQMQEFSGEAYSAVPTEDENIRTALLYSTPIMHPTACFKRCTPLGEQLFYDETFAAAQDAEFWFRLSALGKMKNIDKSLLVRRRHDQQISNRNHSEQLQTTRLVCRKVLERDYKINATEADLDCILFPATCSTLQSVLFLGEIIRRGKNKRPLHSKYGPAIFGFWKSQFVNQPAFAITLALRHLIHVTKFVALPWIKAKSCPRFLKSAEFSIVAAFTAL